MLRINDKTAFPPNNIRALRRARDLTLEALGTMIGTDASTMNKLEKSQMRLTDKWIQPLITALGTTADELLRDPGTTSQGAASPSIGDVRPADVPFPGKQSMPLDLPVLGTAAGSHMGGAFQFEGGVVDYVRRPPALLGAMNAYGLYIEGVSMVPEHNPGDLRFIHPDRPPRLGESVIVQIQLVQNGPTESMIGHLVKRTEKSIFIGKLNPTATVELKRETVKAIHKVLTVNELFGV